MTNRIWRTRYVTVGELVSYAVICVVMLAATSLLVAIDKNAEAVVAMLGIVW